MVVMSREVFARGHGKDVPLTEASRVGQGDAFPSLLIFMPLE